MEKTIEMFSPFHPEMDEEQNEGDWENCCSGNNRPVYVNSANQVFIKNYFCNDAEYCKHQEGESQNAESLEAEYLPEQNDNTYRQEEH